MKWPLVSCLMSRHWRDAGSLVQVVVTRSRDGDEAGPMCVGVFLADLGCLGLKNGHGGFMSHEDRQLMLDQMSAMDPLVEVSGDLAAKLVYEARDYAAGLGFKPHRDAVDMLPLLHDCDPTRSHETVAVGNGSGKPPAAPSAPAMERSRDGRCDNCIHRDPAKKV